MLPDINALQENLMWVRVRETGPESQLSEISNALHTAGFGACPLSTCTDFSDYFPFVSSSIAEHFWMPCPCFSSDIFYWHCVIIRMTESWPWASPQAQAGCTRNPCAVVPAPESHTWVKTSVFLLLPFASHYPLNNPLHYRDAVTFQVLQSACLCSLFFFSDPGGSLDGAESPRKIIEV